MILTELSANHQPMIFLLVITALAAAIHAAVANPGLASIDASLWTAIAPRFLRMVAMKKRHEFYLEGEVSERLATMASRPGASKTAIMTDALKAYFDRRGLLARFQFMVTAPLPDSDRAARALAQERFKAFIEQVSRRVSSGRSVIEHVLSLANAPETKQEAQTAVTRTTACTCMRKLKLGSRSASRRSRTISTAGASHRSDDGR